MARGGAPPWVYKQEQAAMSASYESQVSSLNQRIRELERENAALKKGLEEYRKQLGKWIRIALSVGPASWCVLVAESLAPSRTDMRSAPETLS